LSESQMTLIVGYHRFTFSVVAIYKSVNLTEYTKVY